MSSENPNKTITALSQSHTELSRSTHSLIQSVQEVIQANEELIQVNEKLQADKQYLVEAIAEFLKATSWVNHRDCDSVRIVPKNSESREVHCGTINFKVLESKVAKVFPDWEELNKDDWAKVNNRSHECT
jgi:FtsZ-binding cell division protein ZapB